MDQQDVAYAVGAAFAVYGVYYVVAAFSFPRFFLRAAAVGVKPDGTAFHGWKAQALSWLRNIAALAGVGYFVYRATAPLVDWVPFDWGSHNEDDEWESLRDTLRIFLTPIGMLWLMFACEKAAKAFVNERSR